MKNIFDYLENDIILVCNDDYKKMILNKLSEKKQILKINFKSFQEFSYEIVGKYNIDCYLDLGVYENENYDLISEKLKYSYFIQTDFKENEKLSDLYKIKNKYYNEKFLENKNIDFYRKKKMIFVDADYSNDLLVYSINKLIETFKCEPLFIDTYEVNNNLKVYMQEFDSVKDEVMFLVKDIEDKLSNGILAKNIKVNASNENYYSIIKEMFNLANIDISLPKNITLIEYNYIKMFLKYLCTYCDEDLYSGFSKTLDEVEEISHLDTVKDLLIDILNEMITKSSQNLKIVDIYNYLIYRLKSTTVKKEMLDNTIEFIDCFNKKISKDDIVYLIGFNQDAIPKTYKDDDYLSDLEKRKLGINDSLKANALEKEKVLKVIKSLENVYITYSLSSFEGSLVKSSFLGKIEEEINVINDFYKENIYKSYSKSLLHLDYAKERDLYEKYKTVSLKFKTFFPIFINEKRYDSSFKGLNKELYHKYIKPNLYLSYTSIDSYYECPFKFYLERVLKITKITNLEAIEIGNLFHYVFCELLRNDINSNADSFVNKAIDKFIKEQNIIIDSKKKVYYSIYKEMILKNYEFILSQIKNSKFKVRDLEKEYQITIDKECRVILKGKIDKVLTLKMRGKEYAIVIDYKTGSSDFSFDNVLYGQNMQLLFYYMFLESISEVAFGGAYLTSTLPSSPFLYDNNKSYDEQLKEYFLLNGYSNEDKFILSQIDEKYGTSESFLKGIKLTKDGSLSKNSYKKVLTEEEFDKILNLAKEKINEAINNIIDAKFDISPIMIGKELSCTYCPYKDICFVKDNMIIEKESKKDLSFIRGENNE